MDRIRRKIQLDQHVVWSGGIDRYWNSYNRAVTLPSTLPVSNHLRLEVLLSQRQQLCIYQWTTLWNWTDVKFLQPLHPDANSVTVYVLWEEPTSKQRIWWPPVLILEERVKNWSLFILSTPLRILDISIILFLVNSFSRPKGHY